MVSYKNLIWRTWNAFSLIWSAGMRIIAGNVRLNKVTLSTYIPYKNEMINYRPLLILQVAGNVFYQLLIHSFIQHLQSVTKWYILITRILKNL